MPTATQTSTVTAPPGPSAGTISRPRTRRQLVSQPTERLEADIIDLAARLAAGTYELLVLVGELDERGTWATWGALSCASWLAHTCDIEISTARTQVRVARAMRTHPGLDHSMARGDISYAKARGLTPHLTETNATDLIALAERTPAHQLGSAIAAWSQRHEDPDQIRHRQHQNRSLSWRTEPDGMVVVTTRLTPETAAGFCAVIDTIVMRSHAAPGSTLPQQRADALTTMTTPNTSTAATAAAATITTEVVVHVTADGNHLTNGTPLSDHAVTALLPAAFISLLLHNTQRHPIDASPRRRHPTRRQRRVLDQTHQECQHPGCHATAFLQYDHIQPYAQGGTTTLDNLQRLCGPHNRARNEQNAALHAYP